MLEILDLDVLPDGRSYVDTVGGNRFRVLRRGQRDGYHTADIEYLEDHKVRGHILIEIKGKKSYQIQNKDVRYFYGIMQMFLIQQYRGS